MRIPGFLGPSNTVGSVNVDAERTINLIPEIVDGQATPKVSLWLRGRPGVVPFARLGSSPIRAVFAQDGRVFAVSGILFYEVFASGTALYRGQVAADANPATICSNGTAGNQLFICSGGYGYIYSLTTDTLTLIADADFPLPAKMGAFINGYFVVLKANSRRFQWSALEDGTTWDALDVAEVSMSADNVQSLFVNHAEVWLHGSKVTEVWAPSGDINVFAPIGGAPMEFGTAAAWSIVKLDNSIFWLGADERGQGIVYRADGYSPSRVSTHYVEHYLQGLPRLSDAIGWSVQDGGHSYYLLYVPTADRTLVYDVSTRMWHDWTLWDPDRIVHVPHLGRCHAFGFGRHLVGDRQSGTVYHQSLEYHTDEAVIT